MATERSPSPPATRPIASAPGPRAVALQKLYNEAINHIVKTCNYHNFATCFPTPSAHVPEAMQDVHEQFTTKLRANLLRHFEGTLESRNVVASLNELDGLIEDARRRKARSEESGEPRPTPPHTLPPTQLYLAHLAPSLTKQAETLKARQDAVRAENVELLERVMKQRQEISALVSGLESAVGDLDASVAALNSSEDLGEMTDELRAIDEEMRTET